MERDELLPENRARVVIVSRRARGAGTGRTASSATLSLVPRWSRQGSVDRTAEALRQTARSVPPNA